MPKNNFAVVGAGLAGCECALVLAKMGFEVEIFEQKPFHLSPAHKSTLFSELVCSNSLRSDESTSAIGLLKDEMRALGSFFMQAADGCRVPAGKALAVDRDKFAQMITDAVRQNPRIKITTKQIAGLEDPVLEGFEKIIIAAGPMASDELSKSMAASMGMEYCYFYDAIAPIVWTNSLDMDVVFRASRYEGENAADGGDYLNCPMNRDEYMAFYEALLNGQTCPTHEFEKEIHFEGCMPIEALAARGPKTLSFGPLKPVGLVDPRTGRRPWAVLQLRAENLNDDARNLVGCQTKLLQGEQKRIFGLVPGLANAEYMRFGSMHRNTFVNSPVVLDRDLSLKKMPNIHLAGQITGVEGYVESAACGLWLGLLLGLRKNGKEPDMPPITCALGALLGHLATPAKNFQPSNVNFGLMPEPDHRSPKKERKLFYATRAQNDFKNWRINNLGI